MDARAGHVHTRVEEALITGKAQSDKEGQPCCTKRCLLACMGLWYGILSYALNTNMSVAIVCMVAPTGRDGLKYNETFFTGDGNRSEIYGQGISDLGNNETLHSSAVTLEGSHSERDSFLLSSRILESHTGPPMKHHTDMNASNISLKDAENQTSSRDAKKTDDKHCLTVNAVIYKDHAEFTWNKVTQSLILSGFFYGYILTQIIGGWMSRTFGGKIMIGVNVAVASLVTLLIPLFARTTPYLVVATRVLLGISMGLAIPGWFALTAVWALPKERTRFISVFWFGQTSGAVIGYSSAGVLCVHGFDNGWASIFYVHGTFGLLFGLCWWWLVYRSPEKHPSISKAEKQLLLVNLHNGTGADHDDRIPWAQMLTFRPVLAIFVTQCCDTWTFYLILTCLPQYLKEVLKFDIESIGIYSSLPLLAMMVSITIAGILADYLRSRNLLSITNIRKLFQVSGFLLNTVCLVIPGYLTCADRPLVILCICLCTFFSGMGFTAGYSSNFVDMCPQYASVLFGISNTIASLPGIIAPLVVAELTQNQTHEEWRLVLFSAAGVSSFGAIVYGLFSSSDLAPWATNTKEITVETDCDGTNTKCELLPSNPVI